VNDVLGKPPDRFFAARRTIAAAIHQDLDVFRKRVRDLKPLWIALPMRDDPGSRPRTQRRAEFLRWEDCVLAALVATLKFSPRHVALLYHQLNRRDPTGQALDRRGWQDSIRDKSDGRVLYIPLDGTQPVLAWKDDRLDLCINPGEFAHLLRGKLDRLRRDNFDLYYWGTFPRPELEAAAAPKQEESEDSRPGKVTTFRKR
jgi:hypothetical protein